MKRRGFFRSLAKAAAIVALAPQIAFRIKPAAFEVKLEDEFVGYSCVMEMPTKETTLYSETFFIPPNPSDTVWIENFSGKEALS